MKKQTFFKALKWSGITFLLLVAVLGIHIYLVTRPHIDAHTVAMARIDIRQAINSNEADNITKWLYNQKGIDHVLCNPETDIVVFTFYPTTASANKIVSDFKAQLHYDKAQRFMPSAKDLQSGCPVAATSVTYKIYNFFKHIF